MAKMDIFDVVEQENPVPGWMATSSIYLCKGIQPEGSQIKQLPKQAGPPNMWHGDSRKQNTGSSTLFSIIFFALFKEIKTVNYNRKTITNNQLSQYAQVHSTTRTCYKILWYFECVKCLGTIPSFIGEGMASISIILGTSRYYQQQSDDTETVSEHKLCIRV
ncbi:hypothetical protein ACJX0J_033776, partial [Zea mays]